MAEETCWTSFIGHPTHNLGSQPERCYTCAAKQREERRAFLSAPMPNLRQRLERMLGVERDTAPKVGQD